jgi:uncharacterized protein YegL
MTTPKVKCLPVYIIIDTSYSMRPVEQILNDAIENLYDALITSPRISDFAHISIISFNTDAEVVLRMTDLQSLDSLPELSCGGVTDFGKALALLRMRIDEDIPALNNAGRAVLRPVAFLLTDGQPTDQNGNLSSAWKVEFDALTDTSNRRHPNIVPFGYGAATPDVVRQFGTIPGAAFIAKDDNTAEALGNVIPALLNTLVASARDNELRVPKEVDGFITVSGDVLD